MKFTQKLNLIIEGMGASRNLYQSLPSFNVKDNKFLKIIDNIFVIKKLINYVNDEIEEFNKKSKYKKQIFYVKITTPDEFYQLFQDNLSDPKGVFNLDKFKKEFINKILELYKDKIEKIGDIRNNIRIYDFEYTIFTIDEKYKTTDPLTAFDLSSLMHDVLLHFIINEKDIYKFKLQGRGYEFDSPYKYSPESILNELFSVQDKFKDYSYSIVKFLNRFHFTYTHQFKNKLSPENFLKNLNVNKILLNYLIKFLTLDDDYPVSEKYNFSFKEIQDIKIFLEKNYKKDFEHVIEEMQNILETKINTKSSYSFIQNVINSIEYRKQKFKKINPNDDNEITWKDFRLFFRNYPNLLKLFPQDKYPDDLIILETVKEFDEYGDYIKLIKKDDQTVIGINDKIVNAIHTGQSLMKKAIPRKSDFQNPESIIDFILEKISNLIKNNLNDNSKYYKILEDKLKNK